MRGASFGVLSLLFRLSLLPRLLLANGVLSSSDVASFPVENGNPVSKLAVQSERALRDTKDGKKERDTKAQPKPKPSVPAIDSINGTTEPPIEPTAHQSHVGGGTVEPSGQPSEQPPGKGKPVTNQSHSGVSGSAPSVPYPRPSPAQSPSFTNISPNSKTGHPTLFWATSAPSSVPDSTSDGSFSSSESSINEGAALAQNDEAITFTCNTPPAHAEGPSESRAFTSVHFYYKIEASSGADLGYLISLVGTAVAEAVAVQFLACGRSLAQQNSRKLSLLAVDALPADEISGADQCDPQRHSSTCTVVHGEFTLVSTDSSVNIADILGFIKQIMNAGVFIDMREEVDVSYIGPVPVSVGALVHPEENGKDDTSTMVVGRNSVRAGYAMSISSAFVGSLLLVLVAFRFRRHGGQQQQKENIFDEATWLAHPSLQQQERSCARIKDQVNDSSHRKQGGLFCSMFSGNRSSANTSFAGSIIEESDVSIESMSEMGGSSILGGLRSAASSAPCEHHRAQQIHHNKWPPQNLVDNMSESGVLGQESSTPEENPLRIKWLHDWGIYTYST